MPKYLDSKTVLIYCPHPVYGPCLVHKITDVPVVYMGLVLSGFEGGLSITQGILGGGP